jgi:hypothetical protein
MPRREFYLPGRMHSRPRAHVLPRSVARYERRALAAGRRYNKMHEFTAQRILLRAGSV